MLFCSITNFEMQRYSRKESVFNGVYSRRILHKMKDGSYVKNLDK